MYIITDNILYILVLFCYTCRRNKDTMSNTNGWTMEDWKTFHDLKVKANLHNLEVAAGIFKAEIPLRAEQMILGAYMEVE